MNGWCLHHKDPSWKTEDKERYKQWNIEDLIPMTNEEHVRLHFTGKSLSKETKRKISESMTGEKNPRYGKSMLDGKSKEWIDDWKQRVSEAKKGYPSSNKGKKMSEEQKHKISESLKKYFQNKEVKIKAC